MSLLHDFNTIQQEAEFHSTVRAAEYSFYSQVVSAASLPLAETGLALSRIGSAAARPSLISTSVTSDTATGIKTAVTRNPNVYEALFEAPITGTSRAAHRASANNILANQLRNDVELGRMFNQQLGSNVLQHMQSGRSGLLNPPGTVWHHPFDNPNVAQLLRTSEHTAPSLQSVLHPNGVGGFGNFYGP